MASVHFDLGGLSVRDLARRVWAELSDDGAWDAAAQLGYYFMLALFPLVIFLLSLASFLPRTGLIAPMMTTLAGVMPAQAYDLLSTEVERIQQSSGGGLLTFGMIGTVWAASSGVASLMGTLNRAFDARETRSMLRRRSVAVGLTFAFAALLVAGSSLLGLGDHVTGWAASLVGPTWIGRVAALLLNYAFALVCLLAALEVLYLFGPNVPAREWRWISPGSIVGTMLFLVGSGGFSLYVRLNDSYSVTYGSVEAVIVLMLWLYLLGFAIIVGAEVNSEIELAAGERASGAAGSPVPERAAEPPRPIAMQPATASDPLRTGERLAIRDLIKILEHGNSRVRAGAAAALGNLPTEDVAVVAALVERLADEDDRVREAAARSLERLRMAA